MPQPRPNHSEPAAPPADSAQIISSANPASLADAISTAAGAPPPHLLWATLESAYGATEENMPPDEERLAPYIALPMAIGISLVLWVAIIELVLTRW